MVLKKILNSNLTFAAISIWFIVALAFAVGERGGRDLKVGLFGVEQVLHKKSPYENPTDPNRTIFRYAPALTILEYPFRMKSRMTAPFEFQDMLPSIFSWYFAEILALI
ncbi:MAG: hypothetical protein PHN57_05735, partial [Candidatus Omnitrophica bacterium]|nr:hypothetical protein [Candidatus Omnitrophota bacterium]